MDNRTVLETYQILRGMEQERGLPLKFEYGIGRNINTLEPIVKSLEAIRDKKAEGQKDYENLRRELLLRFAEKDDNGQPVIKDLGNGVQEYQLGDNMSIFKAESAELDKKFAETLAESNERAEEFVRLLDSPAEEFNIYKIKMAYLPIDVNGLCSLSIQQIRYLMPFLDGDIDDLPDPAPKKE
jgi:hypothetical protein